MRRAQVKFLQQTGEQIEEWRLTMPLLTEAEMENVRAFFETMVPAMAEALKARRVVSAEKVTELKHVWRRASRRKPTGLLNTQPMGAEEEAQVDAACQAAMAEAPPVTIEERLSRVRRRKL